LQDGRNYLVNARLQDRNPLLLDALTTNAHASPQPYLAQRDISAQLLFRCGHLPSDIAPGGIVLTTDGIVGPISDLQEPPYLRCPDCDADVNDEHVGHSAVVRLHNIMVHRLTQCTHFVPALKWYYDVAVTIVPTLRVAQMLAPLRCGLANGAASSTAEIARPFLQHLLAPTAICDKNNPRQRRDILRATALLLAYQDRGAPLPAVHTFGDPPRVATGRGGAVVTPSGDVVDDDFWIDFSRLAPPPSVPPAPCAREHEAEARFPRTPLPT
jgi:hypothetical protein